MPAAVICTEPFRPTVEAICATRGVPDYPFVIIGHPIGSLSEDELRARAVAATQRVAKILMSRD